MEEPLVKAYFGADHDRLDSLLQQFRARKRSEFAEAKGYFKAFLTGLRRHMVWEEDVLFPFFESTSGMAEGGPTAVMREEHRRIQQALEAIHEKIRKGSSDTEAEELALLEVLSQHNEKEEQVLYPALDQMSSREEAARLFLKMEQIPSARFETCCEA